MRTVTPESELQHASTRGSAAGTGKVLLIACGALAREVLQIIEASGLGHLEVQCLPAKLHLFPDRIPAAVERLVQANRTKFRSIFVGYADCGTGGLLQRKCEDLGVEMLEGPHCYSFFEGNRQFAMRADEELTTFYLTDFLARQFDAFVWKPLGLDKHPELRDMYFGNYSKLVYLAQTDDPELDRLASDGASRLGLRYERRFTGYGDLERQMQLL